MAAFLLIWINLAVGIIGSEDNPANLMYGAVLLLGLVACGDRAVALSGVLIHEAEAA